MGGHGPTDDTNTIIGKVGTDLTLEQQKKIRANEHKDRIYKIGLARSKDGIHFTKYERNPVLTFGDERRGLLTPNFLRKPDGSVLLIGTRFADTQQIHFVARPGGDRTQLTFYEDTVQGAYFDQTRGKKRGFCR